MNKLSNIKLFCGDVKEVVPKIGKKFDRIIMPLPETSFEFLDLAFSFIKHNGIVHFYCFSKEENIDKIIENIKSERKVEILNIVKCGQRMPRIWRYCIDFRVFV